MAQRRSAAALAVVGGGASAGLVAALAAEVGLPVVDRGSRSSRPVVALVGGPDPAVLDDPVVTAAAVRFVRPGPWLGADRAHELFERSADTVGAGLLLAWSPIVAVAGREIAAAGAPQRVDVRIGTGELADATGLAAWCLAGREITGASRAGPDDQADDVPVVELRTADGATASIDASPRVPPEWWLQAASADTVVRLELAPGVALERNGLPLEVDEARPGRDQAVDAARHLGLAGFLDDVRSGAALDPRRWPAGAHPLWGAQVTALLVAAGVPPES